MQKHILIETITNEMVCANACPMYNQNHYDAEKCRCYKSVILKHIRKLYSAIDGSTKALRSYQYGNSAPDLAEEIADNNEKIVNGE